MTSFDEWASLYDWVYAWKLDDIPFYVDEAKRSLGSVLELGCGTGRVTVPMAQAGIDVVGLDSSAKMLQVARRKARRARPLDGDITWVRSDMREFSLNQKFRLVVIPYRGFLSILNVEQQRRCLENIRYHLMPHGRLIFDIFVPDLDTLTDNTSTLVHSWDVTDPDTDRRLVVWDQSRFDNHNQIMDVRMIMEELNLSGQVVDKLYRDFQIRYIHRYEAQHLLELSGFHVLDVFGDFQRQPLNDTSTDMIWVAESIE